MDRNCSNALMELHWQSACPYWRSRIIDDTFLLVTLRDDSCARQNLFPHEAIFELPDTASVLSSCTSPLRSLKPYINTHIQANLPNNSTPACLFKCGLCRIDTIVLFLPINVRLFFGETHSFRSPWHIFRLAVMHAVRHFTDLISKPCITSHGTGLLNMKDANNPLALFAVFGLPGGMDWWCTAWQEEVISKERLLILQHASPTCSIKLWKILLRGTRQGCEIY